MCMGKYGDGDSQLPSRKLWRQCGGRFVDTYYLDCLTGSCQNFAMTLSQPAHLFSFHLSLLYQSSGKLRD